MHFVFGLLVVKTSLLKGLKDIVINIFHYFYILQTKLKLKKMFDRISGDKNNR